MTNSPQASRIRRTGLAIWSNAYILLSFTALFWAGNSIVGRAARDLTPPAALSFWRWSLALLLLLPLAWPHLKRDWPTLKANWKIMLFLGTLGIGAFNTLLYTGLQSTTALNAMLLQAAQPALILIMAAILMKERTSTRQIAGVIISLAGVLAIISRGNVATLMNFNLNRGDAIIAFAVLLWSIYTVALRRRPAVHPLSFLAATLMIGVVVIAPFYAAEIASGHLIVASRNSALAIAYVAIFPSFFAYLFFNRGVELIGAASTGQFLNILPVMGAGLAMLFLGEQLYIFHMAGIALIFAGIFVAGKKQVLPSLTKVKR
ncbi:DMT family transporter [uncultured Parasphingorhabdus sp.]|uniref:DMT family transporter n=1 Tax=uncultured Parasphingorhabdus sp. TaxID=2709694 RepID=UPI0030DC5FB6|tara:strand:+ start:4065 stop:5018 length:954 start_codon:yes stop_codon:yes gene_type:complete